MGINLDVCRMARCFGKKEKASLERSDVELESATIFCLGHFFGDGEKNENGGGLCVE